MQSLRQRCERHWRIVVRGLDTVDHILRGRSTSISDSTTATPGLLPLRQVITILLICGPIYGLAMGSYAYTIGTRSLLEQAPQLFYSAIKVPLLLAITVSISLPSFFVINTLLGLRDDFGLALRAIISAQAGLTIILVSFFPLTLFVYSGLSDTTANHSFAVLFNAAMFGLASVSAQVLLAQYYRPLVARDHRHRWTIRLWIFVYAFVGIQAGFTMRPFIGGTNAPPEFLRRDSFQNAYVAVLKMTSEVIESWL